MLSARPLSSSLSAVVRLRTELAGRLHSEFSASKAFPGCVLQAFSVESREDIALQALALSLCLGSPRPKFTSQGDNDLRPLSLNRPNRPGFVQRGNRTGREQLSDGDLELLVGLCGRFQLDVRPVGCSRCHPSAHCAPSAANRMHGTRPVSVGPA